MNDPRVEAAANRYDAEIGDGTYLDTMREALAAADRADREQGVHRVRVDDATVERVACALMNSQLERHGIGPQTVRLPSHGARVAARAVLAALTGAGS